MILNQVTLPALDYAASVAFYRRLGLTQIVDAPPRYARFECEGGGTLSIHLVEDAPRSPGVVVYLESETLDETVAQLEDAGVRFDRGPQDETWLWREARLQDPAGNELRLYAAGDNRRFPPWRLPEAG
jgi:hydroxymethylpyrimidine/phosphomethylpyrimidine kinase